MQREIEFRAWDKLNKIMTYNVLNKQPILEMVNVGTPQQDSIIVGLEEYSDLELMQFTGLLDKNGKEIFEGDVVKSKNNHQFVIDFRYGSFGATWLEDDSVWYSCATCSFYKKEFTVIGNIFENPDLLEDNAKI